MVIFVANHCLNDGDIQNRFDAERLNVNIEHPKDLESSSLHSTMSVKDYIIHRLTACVVRYRSLLLYSTPHVVRSE